jgi:thiamine-phosphate pyrophosphorylase
MYLGGLCFITGCRTSQRSCEDVVLEVLGAGIRWIQYRNKDGARREIFKESVTLRKITRDFQAMLIINDHADIALAADADGVHLGQDDLPLKEARKIMGRDKIIGISTHSIDEAVDAVKAGADYIGFGPVFHTITKDAGTPKGVALLGEIRNKVHIPVVAIGGINLNNVRSVFETGADAIAVSSAILSGKVAENVERFIDIKRSFL